MASPKQPVSIDGIEFDALIDLTESYSADFPTYPVESGFEISDSIILKPLALSMTLFLTNTPVTWASRHAPSPSRVQDVLKKLEGLYFKKTPVTVLTNEKTYKNMAISSIELAKTMETGSSREIPISFQEIRVTEAKTATIPDSYGKSGTTGKNAGTASTKRTSTPTTSATAPSSGSSNGTVAYELAKSAGFIGDKASSSNMIGGLFGGGD